VTMPMYYQHKNRNHHYMTQQINTILKAHKEDEKKQDKGDKDEIPNHHNAMLIN
jgi:hypothetical protein